jgi:hypothetical protein
MGAQEVWKDMGYNMQDSDIIIRGTVCARTKVNLRRFLCCEPMVESGGRRRLSVCLANWPTNTDPSQKAE